MRRASYRKAAWVATAILVGVAATLIALSSDTDAPDPRAIVALAAGVDPADVRITRVWGDEAGKERRVEAVLTSDRDRAVMVTYEAQTGLLRQVYWIGVGRGTDESGGTTVTLEQAQAKAEELMARLFPDVPVQMELTKKEKLIDKPVYHFAWAASPQPEVYTGDQVSILVSITSGVPFSYTQNIARVRPSLDEIRITREQAIELAEEASERWWLEESDLEVTVETKSVRLVLSSVQSPHYGPVWMVDQEIHPPETSTTQIMWPLTSQTIDAMSGEVLSVAPH